MFSIFGDPGSEWHRLPGFRVRADDSVQILGDPGRDALLLDGVLFPDAGSTPADLLRMCRTGAPIEDWRLVKGCFAGAYLGADGITVFNDHAGIQDLYGWISEPGSGWAVGTDFAVLANGVPAHIRRLDESAAVQYSTLGTTVNGRTLAAGIRRLPPSRHTTIRPGKVTAEEVWRYQKQPADWEMDEAVERCWELLNQAAARIRAVTGPDSRGLLGLSGGRDSRLVARICLDAGMDVQPYFFGEPESDAAGIVIDLASALGLKVLFPGRNREFPLLFEQSLAFQPLADLEWCKYLICREGMPAESDAMLSGHLGDHLFGERSFRAATGPENDRELARELYFSCAQEKASPDVIEQITEEIEETIARIGGSVIMRKEGFFFHTINMTVKQCGLFRAPGSPRHFSPFEDIDVLEAALAIPDTWRLRNRFYRRLFAAHLSDLDPARIRAATSSDHKPIDAWLRGNEEFLDAFGGVVDPDTMLPGRDTSFRAAAAKIHRGNATKNEIHQFFRHLTVQAYRSRYG